MVLVPRSQQSLPVQAHRSWPPRRSLSVSTQLQMTCSGEIAAGEWGACHDALLRIFHRVLAALVTWVWEKIMPPTT
eukprot:10491250-Prorocentrum_lima.AAC.1